MQKSGTLFKAGDRVRHESRPEWGIGRIQRVENVTIGGKSTQRISVRFPNAGLKTLSSLGADLSVVEDIDSTNGDDEGSTLVQREAAHESGWLGAISKKRPEDAMTELPAEVTDPFATLESRLKHMIGLYRFTEQSGSLIDWAVARSGLDDPLSRFTRHELEEFFDRWATLRDRQLAALLKEAGDTEMTRRLMADAPASAKRLLRKSNKA